MVLNYNICNFRYIIILKPSESLASRYNRIIDEVTRISIAGDGERHCAFRLQFIDCDLMSYFQESNFKIFLKGFQKFMNALFKACGKNALRDKLGARTQNLISSAKISNRCEDSDRSEDFESNTVGRLREEQENESESIIYDEVSEDYYENWDDNYDIMTTTAYTTGHISNNLKGNI